MNLAQFITTNSIKLTSCTAVNENPNIPDWQDAHHYKVTLKHGRRQFTLYWSQWYRIQHEPFLDDILDALASDSTGYEGADSFEAWADENGYDTDSRKAEKTYKLIGSQARKLKQFLGEDNYKQLLWDIERI
jgi:hypothetical protein